MSENSTNPLLDGITQMEAAAFRAGQVARRLLSEHPDLKVRKAVCSLYSYVDSLFDTGEDAPKLDIHAECLDGVRTWAQAMGVELKLSTRGTKYNVYESAEGEADVDGVTVIVSGSRVFSDDEAAAWRAQQTQATAGGEG